MNKMLPFYFAKSRGVYIEAISDEALAIVTNHQFSLSTFLELQRYYGRKITHSILGDQDFEAGLARIYEQGDDLAVEAVEGMQASADLESLVRNLPATEDLLESQDDAPVIKLLNALLARAIREKASDIHIETFEGRLLIRFRLDGNLQPVLEPPDVLAPLLISRLKVMARLDIAEKRLPQDGRISLRVAGRAVDVRISTIPTHYGERIVLRLLDKQSVPLNLSSLGMASGSLQSLRHLICQPYGIILVTGPTGSGKTTTLYAALSEINDVSRNILTVEDPIEYYLEGIGQTQVNPKVDMTFARGLRAILRQDPDVVMVGEIRDVETAQMAVQASLTGHLVLSTLHTNSAVGAITRLRDMGTQAFLLASTLIGVVAQRLLRLLCSHCKTACEAGPRLKIMAGVAPTDKLIHYKPRGCDHCRHTGYRGRTGIYEVVLIDEVMRRMIHDNKSEAQLDKQARLKYPDMRRAGWQQVIAGKTSVAEVLRVIGGET